MSQCKSDKLSDALRNCQDLELFLNERKIHFIVTITFIGYCILP